MIRAYGYLRVSGPGQVKGDGLVRQEKAIRKYAESNGIEIVKLYKEKGVSGDLASRPVLANMLVDLEENAQGISSVIIDKLDRLARDLLVQEAIIKKFRESGTDLISAIEGPDLLDNDPTRKLVRQILGAIGEYEKSMLVEKLRVARKRQKAKNGKCEGRKSYREISPNTGEYIRHLRGGENGSKKMTYRKIAEQLNHEGIPTLNGQPWNLQTVRYAFLYG